METPIVQTAADRATGAANATAVVTYAADAFRRHILAGVAWSYSGTPTGGGLRIEDGAGTTVFEVDITQSDVGQLNFDPPIQASASKAMVVTLLAGGAGVIGKLNCQHASI